MNKVSIFLMFQSMIVLLLVLTFTSSINSIWILVFILFVILQMIFSFKNIELLIGLSTIINTISLLFFLIPYLGGFFKILYIVISIMIILTLLIFKNSGMFIIQKNSFDSNFKSNFKKRFGQKQFKSKQRKKSKFEDSNTQDVKFEEK